MRKTSYVENGCVDHDRSIFIYSGYIGVGRGGRGAGGGQGGGGAGLSQ